VKVSTESILNLMTLPATICFVHPVRVVSAEYVAVLIVIGADAVIESAFVGGLFAAVSTQISTTQLPDAFPKAYAPTMSQENGMYNDPFAPASIAAPSLVTTKVSASLQCCGVLVVFVEQ
jgi:hypothetical protein